MLTVFVQKLTADRSPETCLGVTAGSLCFVGFVVQGADEAVDWTSIKDTTKSDTPRRAGGLMSWAASKAVGACSQVFPKARLGFRVSAPIFRRVLEPRSRCPKHMGAALLERSKNRVYPLS